MKKILSIFITILVLLSCLGFAVSADVIVPGGENETVLDPNIVISFSDDFKILYYGDVEYSAFPNEKIPYWFDYAVENKTLLTEEQKKDISDISLSSNENGVAISATFRYTYGASLNIYYFRNDYVEEYNRVDSLEGNDLYILFSYFYEGDAENEISVKTSLSKLKGEKVKLEVDEYYLNDYFEVSAKSDKLNILVEKGCLLDYDGEYYYIDFAETNFNLTSCDYYTYKGDAYKITDPALIQQIEDGLLEYYQEDYGIFFDDNFTKIVSRIFITIVFAIIPFAIFIFTLILAIKSKNPYKKLHLTACILSLAELITLALILIIT